MAERGATPQAQDYDAGPLGPHPGELAGLTFDSLQQVFRKSGIAMALKPLLMDDNRYVLLVTDPAAGGPQLDYAIVSQHAAAGAAA